MSDSAVTRPALEASGISKSYGAVTALKDASFSADFGEVHAVVGENGAGKSTLIKILCGVTRPDTGRIRVDGKEVAFAGPRGAREYGISTVFQELTLFPWMTVGENLVSASPPRGRLGLIRRADVAPRAEAMLGSYGLERINSRLLAAQLSVADQQIVEIVRALEEEPRILFVDEPTAALGAREVDWLFTQLARLRDAGACILFTSHRWSEVDEIADRITVFRDGADVATRDHLVEDEAVRLMTGRQVDRNYPDVVSRPPSEEIALALENVTAPGVSNVSLEVRAGEVLGVGGLAGQGQRELFQTIFGVAAARSGTIRVRGARRRIRTPSDAIRRGIALVPEDRKSEGLLLTRSVQENLTLGILNRISRLGFLRSRRAKRLSAGMVSQLAIKSAYPSIDVVGDLSGGHQQKVLLGRWLLVEPQILLLYDVTRGVDVATKHEIYELIAEFVKRDRAVLMFSSETEEIAHLCHRVVVLHEGAVRAELVGDRVTAENIVAAAI